MLGGPGSAALPSRAGPPGHLSPARGRGQSSVPAPAEVATGLTLPQAGQHPRRGSPWKGPAPPTSQQRGPTPSPGSHREPGHFRTKGSPAPQPRSGDANGRARAPGPAGLPTRRRGRGAAPGTCAPAQASPLARPPPPAPLPGFSPASAEEVAEESVRTLGSLCERPRDTRQPLPSSDAAMGPAGVGASWREPRGIRASEAAKVTAEGAGGGVFLKSKIKKAGEREGAGGPRWRFRALRQ